MVMFLVIIEYTDIALAAVILSPCVVLILCFHCITSCSDYMHEQMRFEMSYYFVGSDR